jgi:hypothetical protein
MPATALHSGRTAMQVMHHRLLHRVGIVDQQRPADRSDVAAVLGFEDPVTGGRRARIDDALVRIEVFGRARH